LALHDLFLIFIFPHIKKDWLFIYFYLNMLLSRSDRCQIEIDTP
jgi:hypothetical protein